MYVCAFENAYIYLLILLPAKDRGPADVYLDMNSLIQNCEQNMLASPICAVFYESAVALAERLPERPASNTTNS